MLAEGSRLVKGGHQIPSFHGEHAANRDIPGQAIDSVTATFHGKPSTGPGHTQAISFHGKHPASRALLRQVTTTAVDPERLHVEATAPLAVPRP
jgi:hypothetical protein